MFDFLQKKEFELGLLREPVTPLYPMNAHTLNQIHSFKNSRSVPGYQSKSLAPIIRLGIMARELSTADQQQAQQAPKTTRDRLELLEAQMAHLDGIVDGVAQLGERLENVEHEYGSLAERITVLDEDMRGTMNVLQEQLGDLAAKVNLLMRAIGSADPSVGERTKIKVPEHEHMGELVMRRSWKTSFSILISCSETRLRRGKGNNGDHVPHW